MTFRRPIEREHLRRLFKLRVTPRQEDQVAANSITIAEAAYEPGSAVWGLWSDDAPIGLLAMIDLAQRVDCAPEHRHVAYVWRLMIDATRQGEGYGRLAMAEALKVAAEWGKTRIILSAVEKENGALPFYTHLGFARTGKITDGEIELAAAVDALQAQLKT